MPPWAFHSTFNVQLAATTTPFSCLFLPFKLPFPLPLPAPSTTDTDPTTVAAAGAAEAASLASLLQRTLTVLSAHERRGAFAQRQVARPVPPHSRRTFDRSLLSSTDQDQHDYHPDQDEHDDQAGHKHASRSSSSSSSSPLSSIAQRTAAPAPTPWRTLRTLPTAPVLVSAGQASIPDSGAMTPGTPSIDQHGLGWPAARTLDRMQFTPTAAATNEARLAAAVTTILQCLGEDPYRPGIRETPKRYAKALLWLTRGYETKLDVTSCFMSALSHLGIGAFARS